MTVPWVIHIVEDDGPVRDAFAFALEAVGYRTVTHADADDFLARWRGERGVLVSDVRMPGMNGLDLTRRLRREGSTMPIVLMTGHAEGDVQTDATAAGADLVLGKPVDLDTLVAGIERVTRDW